MRLEDFDEIKVRKVLDERREIKDITFVHPLGEPENKDPECRAYLSVLVNGPDTITIGCSEYRKVGSSKGHVAFIGLNRKYEGSIDITFKRK